VGCVCVPRHPAGGDGAGHLRGPEGAHRQAEAALKKTRCADCGALHRGWYDRAVRRVRDLSCGDTRVYLEIEVRRVLCRSSICRLGGKVRRERLEFLADNPLYTKRFATFVGRRCRVSTIKDVAKELRLDWETVISTVQSVSMGLSKC
jgi:transposase